MLVMTGGQVLDHLSGATCLATVLAAGDEDGATRCTVIGRVLSDGQLRPINATLPAHAVRASMRRRRISLAFLSSDQQVDGELDDPEVSGVMAQHASGWHRMHVGLLCSCTTHLWHASRLMG